MRFLGLLAVLITGALLIYAADDFPDWGDPTAPASAYRVSRHYITQTHIETGVPNLVTAVLADYRGYDTLFETVVIFTAGIAILAILRVFPRKGDTLLPGFTPDAREEPDIILVTTSRILVPIIQLFALYVIAHGHHSPGGGFQGGVIFAASLVLLALTQNLKTSLALVSERRAITIACAGVAVYGGIGLSCMLLGSNFLDYSVLHRVLPGLTEIESRYHSMLGVEIGVALTVTAIMFSIYANLSSKGKLHDGM